MVYDYSKGKIYILKSNYTDKIYVGSTIQQLDVRLNRHKGAFKLYFKGKYEYVTSFEILKFADVEIVEKEPYPCSSKRELEKRESYWIEYYKDICVNKIKPNTSPRKKSGKSIYQIYKLISPHTVNIYVGHTIQLLEHRKNGHRQDFRKWQIGKKIYNPRFELFKLGINDVKIVYLDKAYDIKQACILEQYYINLYKDIVLNKHKAYRSPEEKKEYDRKYLKEYYENPVNKENIKKKSKEYVKKRQQNSPYVICECGSKYKTCNKSAHLECKKHKDFINGIVSNSIKCECGGSYTENRKAEHCKTKIHQNYLKKHNMMHYKKTRNPDYFHCAICETSIIYNNKNRHCNGIEHIQNLFNELPFLTYENEDKKPIYFHCAACKTSITYDNKKRHCNEVKHIKNLFNELPMCEDEYTILSKKKEERNRKERENNKKEKPILCECGKHYKNKSKARHLRSQFHQNFVNGIKPSSDLVECECGGKYNPKWKADHNRTQRHKNYLKNNSDKKVNLNLYECAVCKVSIIRKQKNKHNNGINHIKNIFNELSYELFSS